MPASILVGASFNPPEIMGGSWQGFIGAPDAGARDAHL